MKLFKKVLAAALAGVLALSVLTGCNNATVTMVDALNEWAKVYGMDTTFEKGDEKLQAQVNDLVKIVDEVSKDISFEGVKDLEDVYEAFWKDETAREKLGAWAAQFKKANIGDGSPLYQYGVADISVTLSASSSKNIYYANQLMMTSGTPINAPDTVWGHGERNWTVGDKSYVAVATCEVGGRKYMVALFKTTAEKNPDYKPNQNPDKN